MSEDIQHLLMQVPLAGMVLLVVGMFLAYLKQHNTKMETALGKVAEAQTETAKQLGKAETVLARVFDLVRRG